MPPNITSTKTLQNHIQTIKMVITWYFLLHQHNSDTTMSITPALWQSARIKENETLTECLACGNIISACFCALFFLCRWYVKALDWCSLCSVSIRSELISLNVWRSLVWSPEQISWLWSPVFLDFLFSTAKPTSTSDGFAFRITKPEDFLY